MMKKFKILLFLVTLISIYSCNPEKYIMESVLIPSLKVQSEYKLVEFRKSSTYTLKDEVEDRIKNFEFNLTIDKTDVKFDSISFSNAKKYRSSKTEIEESKNKLDKSRSKYEKDLAIINYLKSIEKQYPELYDKVTYQEFSLAYKALNGFGMPVVNICTGRFNMKGQMVAIKLNENSSWILLDDFFSIPGYYDMILTEDNDN